MNRAFRELCKEVASGDVGSQRFSRLWMETGIPLSDEEFEIANRLLAKIPEHLFEEDSYDRVWH